MFLKRVIPPQEEVQTSPSMSVPKTGIVIIEYDSFMHVIAPEELPVGQDVEVILEILTLCRPRLICVFVSQFLTKRFFFNKKFLKVKN